METLWIDAVVRQSLASLEMLAKALRNCPDSWWEETLWDDPSAPGLARFWYLAYHTLFWTDLYLSGSTAGFIPPAPFTLSELDPAGLLPERVYTRAELLAYLDHCREKIRVTVGNMTPEQTRRMCRFPWVEMPHAELLLDNLRHIQEHGAQLNLFLGRQAGLAAGWVTFPNNQ